MAKRSHVDYEVYKEREEVRLLRNRFYLSTVFIYSSVLEHLGKFNNSGLHSGLEWTMAANVHPPPNRHLILYNMSFVIRDAVANSRFIKPSTVFNRRTQLNRAFFSTSPQHQKGPIEATKDTLKAADRLVSDAAVKGIEKGGSSGKHCSHPGVLRRRLINSVLQRPQRTR
ncbi:hypothetical protein H113_01951 [Trichophyton rubrum MR1459]|uniref:Uncharacterized protein n=1 Tax=Trichophyton rubrum (strain ATCC MYA-4607 / CBS 118892) TaxID=559305 RepID=F2SVZ4_TRIRC|nr:uncharacterized protein TERG_06715 [Trichophyton rubrum CBS 118892]EGD90488.2 hypothetical protein TERG_06715 [Trichophyton rubrum CBS 118892]EZF98263.1 hypothetical protein H113_01951 [Trichophyton rubrum MR1459]